MFLHHLPEYILFCAMFFHSLTLRGIGVTKAADTIQIDRYSMKNDNGAAIDFLDTANKFMGWKAILDKPNAWLQYNTVDFEKKQWKALVARAASVTGGTLQLHL